METSYWKGALSLVVAAVVFFAGFRAGQETGYDTGFRDGASATEEYAKECYSDLDDEVERMFGVSAFDATYALNKYDGEVEGVYLFDKYNDIVNSHYALEYFYNNIWDKLCDVSEAAIELAEIDDD